MVASLPGPVNVANAMRNPATATQVPEHVRRQWGGPSLHTKHSAAVATRYTTTWQEEYEALDAQELKSQHGPDMLRRCGPW